MWKKSVRNHSYIPYLEKEGKFVRPLPHPPPVPEGVEWHARLTSHERLFFHQTLSSARSSKLYKQTSNVPRDSLDYQLIAHYDHAKATFPAKVDPLLQYETCTSKETFRKLRNRQIIKAVRVEDYQHPLRIAGILNEKLHPDNIKLIISGPHVQLTNNGYSRQQADGNPFRY